MIKGAYRRLFLCALAGATLLLAAPAQAGVCLPAASDEEDVAVSGVHDGDTLRLEDGRKVRLLGIDSPELGRDGRPDQPYAARAREHLRRLIEQAGWRISLSHDRDRYDRYGRLLAHATIGKQDTALNLNASLLQAGMAVAYVTPPNDSLADCYRELESNAAANRDGLWSHPRYQPLAAAELLRNPTGFRIVEAAIDEVDFKRRGVWLRALPLQVYIANQDVDKYFDRDRLRALEGRRVRMRGWLHKDRHAPASRRFMKLRHPSAIALLP